MFPDRSKSGRKRLLGVLVLVALATLGYAAFDYAGNRQQEQYSNADYRAPVANPPVDPNRPDLFEEPQIDE